MEKPLFEATFRATREECLAIARARSGQHARTIWLLNLMVALCVAVLWAVRSRNAIWLTVVLAVLLLHSILNVRVLAARMYAARNASVDGTSLRFFEDRLETCSSVEEGVLRYSQITGLSRDGRYLIIYARHHTPLVVNLETMGNRGEALAQFLTQKTGQELRQ